MNASQAQSIYRSLLQRGEGFEVGKPEHNVEEAIASRGWHVVERYDAVGLIACHGPQSIFMLNTEKVAVRLKESGE